MHSRFRFPAYPHAQGYSVSKAVRQLLALWVDGAIDLAAIERARLGSLPKMEELRELAAALREVSERMEGVGQAVCNGEEALKAMLWRYERVLRGYDVRPSPDVYGLPLVFQRAILGKDPEGW